MTPEPAGIVVVGASLAGLRGAEALREAGFSGSLTIVGAEPHLPYDRPPLSKHVLAGELAADATRLPELTDLHARWRLGSPAISLDRAARTLRLAAMAVRPTGGIVTIVIWRAAGFGAAGFGVVDSDAEAFGAEESGAAASRGAEAGCE